MTPAPGLTDNSHHLNRSMACPQGWLNPDLSGKRDLIGAAESPGCTVTGSCVYHPARPAADGGTGHSSAMATVGQEPTIPVKDGILDIPAVTSNIG
jgi:hypothetical protein